MKYLTSRPSMEGDRGLSYGTSAVQDLKFNQLRANSAAGRYAGLSRFILGWALTGVDDHGVVLGLLNSILGSRRPYCMGVYPL